MTTRDSVAFVLSTLRGTLPRARANARSVAALTENPACTRRRVIDAAGVRAYQLAERLGHPVTRGQSPFAIATGNQFESRLKQGSSYARLVEALAPFIALPARPRIADLGSAPGLPPGDVALRHRAKATEGVLAAIAREDPDAPQIIDHPVLVFEVGGIPAFLEPDALAFRVGSQLELVEIKSYPIIDGQADPGKLASTAGQAAVYLLALRATLGRLGFDSEILRPSAILVAPRNFGRFATAHRVPLKKKMMALERVLRAIPKTATVLETLALPKTLTFDVDPAGNEPASVAREELDHAVRALPMVYVPSCLSSCDLAKYCRNQAIVDDDPSRLGREVRESLAGVSRLQDALRLATQRPGQGERHLREVAEALRSARNALERARAQVPGLGTSPSARTRRASAR